jgi:hypothetical protein
MRGKLNVIKRNVEKVWGARYLPKNVVINKFMQLLKKSTITESVRLHISRWFGHVQRMEENGFPKRVLCMNLEPTS